MGGREQALEAGVAALLRGIPVVSANKASLARGLSRYMEAAREGHTGLGFESACAAHIPIIEALDRSLACEEISVIKGVVNGTTNYILTLMEVKGWSFAQALADATAKGFTEADPSLDVDGIDAAEKLTLLVFKAFGQYVPPDQIHTEGISRVTKADMQLSQALNHRIKLIAGGRVVDGKLNCSVHPALIHRGELLADVDSEFNAIIIEGPNFKELTFLGKGAGQLPTASALPGFVKLPAAPLDQAPTKHLSYCYFLRLKVLSSGIVDGVVSFLETQNVKVLSRAFIATDEGEYLGLITDVVKESRLSHLMQTLKRVDGVLEDPAFIRLDKDNYREIVELEQRAYFGSSLERQPGARI
jgi:homoserine dehydrogenase